MGKVASGAEELSGGLTFKVLRPIIFVETGCNGLPLLGHFTFGARRERRFGRSAEGTAKAWSFQQTNMEIYVGG